MATYFGGVYESRTGGYYFRFPDFIDYVVPPSALTIKGHKVSLVRPFATISKV